MDTLQRTKDILGSAEKSLAVLASDAAKETDYDGASVLIELAREMNSLAATLAQRLGTGIKVMPAALPAPESNGLVAKAKPKKASYPKFFRQGDDLVKIGWSRSEKAEYEHKSPKKVLLLLAAAIARLGANGRRFAMEHLMPLQNADGTRIPDYQVYLCLAWFRELGLVVQHGRQGYSVSANAFGEAGLDAHWASLARR